MLSYNAPTAYLRAVLAWKSVFDNADLTGIGAVPFVAALERAGRHGRRRSEPQPTRAAPRRRRSPSAPAHPARP